MESNVIKARTLLPTAQRTVVTRSAQVAYSQANEIVSSAHCEAERILTGARQTAEALIDSAKQDGYRNGAAQWCDSLTAVHKLRDEYLTGNEPALLQLAVRIAGKLIGEELRLSPETIATIVREALRSVRGAKEFTIQAHPADAAILSEHLTTLRKTVGLARDIEIVSNPSLSRGDCLIQSDVSLVDARLETQLNNVERAVITRTTA